MVMKTLNTYMHNIGVIWLNAPSTIMDSRQLFVALWPQGYSL